MEELDIHVALNIVSRASYDCITDVSGMLLTSRFYRSLVYNHTVLHTISLQLFFSNVELINLHSPYRPFFTRCLHAHNSTTSYLESLKLAVREGHAETALQLLLTITNGPPHVYFATALLQLVLGSYEEAITIDTFVESVGSFEVADEIRSQVFRQMMQIGTHKIRSHSNTWNYRDIPQCGLYMLPHQPLSELFFLLVFSNVFASVLDSYLFLVSYQSKIFLGFLIILDSYQNLLL